MIGHLERLVEEGVDVEWGHLLPSAIRRLEIEAVFEIVGDDLLRPVFDELGGQYSYNEIRVTRLARRQAARETAVQSYDSAGRDPRSMMQRGR